jgi:hypothetical protein
MWSASWFQTLPEPPAPEDTNGVLLYFATLAVGALAWVVRRYVGRIEKQVDEMTPLLREQTDLLRGLAEASERRDADAARIIGELRDEVARLDRRADDAPARRRP